ncbi:MAG: ammonium transporter [bacterium]|nr:ammonium transporter [bacterium]MCS7308967.1 ammonium transporter [Armatimonadota bacterium]MDW8103687.1 ammonium transporter [Armatimonadota bacterium]
MRVLQSLLIRRALWLGATLALLSLLGLKAWAQENPSVEETLANHKMLLDTLWVMVAAFLVFWMQAGFAYVEGGLTRAKNTNNIMMKNLMDFAIGSVAFWAVGFAFMFGDGNPFIGLSGWFLSGPDNSPATGDAYQGVYSALNWTGVPLFAKFMFQLVFAATAATIVSGAMAERTKFSTYLIYSFVVSAFIYPVVGHWVWGGGWLAKLGMWDFAGSTVVHSTGGWLALVGTIMLGPRIGKYSREGKPLAIPGHSLPMAALGVFILWLGWFGFNPGSTMAADASIGMIALNTNIAAAVAAIAAMFTSWKLLKKPDPSMSLNGALAGLVAITAPCAFVSPLSSAIIGLAAGIVVVLSVLALDRAKVDDPVGAVSVHGVCGALGTLALGLFAQEGYAPANTTGNGLLFGGGVKLLLAQAAGVGAVFVWCLLTGFVLFGVLKATIGIRVSAEEEIAGLDVGEHGISAYPDFVLATPGQFSVTGGTRPATVLSTPTPTPAPKPSSETSA